MTPEEFKRLTAKSSGAGFHRCVCEKGCNMDQDQSLTCERVIRGKVCGARIVFANWRVKGRRG